MVTAPGVFDSLAHGQRTLHEMAARADAEMLPWSIAFNDRRYRIWSKTGGELTRLSPEEQVEFRRRTSTVAEAVLEDQPEVLAVYKVMKEAAERTRGKYRRAQVGARNAATGARLSRSLGHGRPSPMERTPPSGGIATCQTGDVINPRRGRRRPWDRLA